MGGKNYYFRIEGYIRDMARELACDAYGPDALWWMADDDRYEPFMEQAKLLFQGYVSERL